MKDLFRRHAFGIVFTLLLTAFTAYSLLDVFVIPRNYGTVEEGGASEENGAGEHNLLGGSRPQVETGVNGEPIPEEPIITDTRYYDGNVSIELATYREKNTTVYVAEVMVSSPEYLKTALAKNTYGRNITEETSDMAERAGAILAVNGDYYGARNRGYVIRNGVLYRESSNNAEDLVIYRDGSFGIIQERSVTAASLLEKGAVQVLSFGPGLIEDGKISVTASDEVGQAMASNPRTAIGIIGENHYVFVVSDGRTTESAGLSLLELATFMEKLGVKTAYNLDGGGSSAMVFNGRVVNKPTSNGRSITERKVSDIVYIG